VNETSPKLAGDQEAETPSPRRVLGVALALVLAVAAVFGPTRQLGFIEAYDDNVYLLENPVVRDGLSAHGLREAWTESAASNWHPLTWLSHMLDVELYGLAPAGHHLTSVALHAAATVLLFLALVQMTGALWKCAFVAALFALHPLRLESVAWVSERKDVLAGMFWMAALLAYARYVRRPALGRYLAVVACFALGLLSKPMLVTLPFVLLLLDYWPLRRTALLAGRRPAAAWSRLLVEKLPLLALAAASCAMTLWAQQFAMRSFDEIPFPLRLQNALVSYVRYLGMLAWPADLAVIYPYPTAGIPGSRVALAVGLLFAISALALITRRRHPSFLVGWLWYVGTLVPVIGLVQVGMQSHADRYTYLPSVGVLLALAWTVPALLPPRSWARWSLAVGATLLLGLASLEASRLLPYWRDSGALFERAVSVSEDNAIAQRALGLWLWKQGRRDAEPASIREAERLLRLALRSAPLDVDAMEGLGALLSERPGRAAQDEALRLLRGAVAEQPDRVPSLVNLGLLLIRRGQLDEAERHLERALAVEGGRHAGALHLLGDLRARRGEWQRAIASYQAALEVAPDSYDTLNNLGRAYQQTGEFERARASYERALRAAPEDPGVLNNLGVLATKRGRLEEAEGWYERALARAPASERARILYNLAEVQLKLGAYPQAMATYAALARNRPRDPQAHLALGRAQLRMGQIDEARRSFERVLELAPGNVDARRELDALPVQAPEAVSPPGNRVRGGA
jgi:protein O-mannosyl-transferase